MPLASDRSPRSSGPARSTRCSSRVLSRRRRQESRRRVVSQSGTRRAAPSGSGPGWRPCRGPGLTPAHRRAYPVALGLVGRREHHAAAHRDGPAAQPRAVALLDSGVERLEVGVHDRSLGTGSTASGDNMEHMFDPGSDMRRSHGARRALAPRPSAQQGQPLQVLVAHGYSFYSVSAIDSVARHGVAPTLSRHARGPDHTGWRGCDAGPACTHTALRTSTRMALSSAKGQ